MRRSHIVFLLEDGEIEKHPLKQWLRENPEFNPPGLHPDDNTSHQLRKGLQRQSWKLGFTPNEVLLIRPDANGNTAYADKIVELQDEKEAEELGIDEDESFEVTFGLEKDLQAALRGNIEQLEEGLVVVDGGAERTTKAGRLDILAQDNDGNLVSLHPSTPLGLPLPLLHLDLHRPVIMAGRNIVGYNRASGSIFCFRFST